MLLNNNPLHCQFFIELIHFLFLFKTLRNAKIIPVHFTSLLQGGSFMIWGLDQKSVELLGFIPEHMSEQDETRLIRKKSPDTVFLLSNIIVTFDSVSWNVFIYPARAIRELLLKLRPRVVWTKLFHLVGILLDFPNGQRRIWTKEDDCGGGQGEENCVCFVYSYLPKLCIIWRAAVA